MKGENGCCCCWAVFTVSADVATAGSAALTAAAAGTATAVTVTAADGAAFSSFLHSIFWSQLTPTPFFLFHPLFYLLKPHNSIFQNSSLLCVPLRCLFCYHFFLPAALLSLPLNLPLTLHPPLKVGTETLTAAGELNHSNATR